MGHIVTSDLPEFATLSSALEFGRELHADDAVVGPVFVSLPWGPVAVLADGTAREAEIVVRGDGLRWVVLA